MVFENVGMEPSGDAFNSLIKLEGSNSHPYNPMINSGAIAVASFIEPKVSFEEMLKLARCFCQDDGIVLDEKVYGSEMSTVARNRAIAYLLESRGVINGNVEEALDFYVKMCSLSVTAESLARLGLLLANDGVDPSGKRLLNSDTVRVVKTIMLTCGMYDGSGEFAVRVGIPSKSGVGGGLLSVVDGRWASESMVRPWTQRKQHCGEKDPAVPFLTDEIAYFCEERLSSFLMKGNSSSGYDESMKVVRDPGKNGRTETFFFRKN